MVRYEEATDIGLVRELNEDSLLCRPPGDFVVADGMGGHAAGEIASRIFTDIADKYLSEYIFMEFGYPVYEYKEYSSGKYELISYNKDKVLKKCNKALKEAKEKRKERLLESENGRKALAKDYKSMSKKKLKKILKDRNLYTENMSKSEMIDTLKIFM